MHTFSLATFIKICQLGTGDRISEISRKLDDQDGYDFYHTLNKSIKSKSNGASSDAVRNILESPSRDVERNHNTSAYDAFEEKFGRKRSLKRVSVNGHVFSPDRVFRIQVEPLFSVTEKGVHTAFAIWPMKKPKLTQRYGAVACYVLRQALNNSSLANGQFAFFDLIAKKKFSEKQITNKTSLIFKADCDSISSLLGSL